MHIKALITMLGIMSMASSASAELITHTGIIRSMKGDTVIIEQPGNSQKSLEYSQDTICYQNGQEVACRRISLGSKVRVDCPSDKACVRIIVDQAPQ